MKFLVVLCILFAIVLADDWKPFTQEEYSKVREDCFKEYKISDEVAEKIKKYKYDDEDVVRCYLKCSSEKVGIWDANKGFDVDRFYDQIGTKDTVVTDKDGLRKCFDSKKDDEDDCKWVYRNFMCVVNNGVIQRKKN